MWVSEHSLPYLGERRRPAQEPKSQVIDPSRLQHLPLFVGISAAAQKELATRTIERTYAAGASIFSAGDEARGMYVVTSGRVRVVRDGSGRRHVLHEEGPGGTLGEVPLFEGGGYPATAIAAEETSCFFISRDAIAAAMRVDPEMAWRFLGRLAARVRLLVERIDRLTARSVPQRLAALLLARHETAGNSGAPVTLGGTQQEIAEELGTVREVVVRAIRTLCGSGAIEPLGRGRYHIRSARRLQELAG
jgi:CRP/FNR family transcriptional regulator